MELSRTAIVYTFLLSFLPFQSTSETSIEYIAVLSIKLYIHNICVNLIILVFCFGTGLQLCFGQPVDHVLLKLIESELAELKDSIKLWKEDKEYDKVQSFVSICIALLISYGSKRVRSMLLRFIWPNGILTPYFIVFDLLPKRIQPMVLYINVVAVQ